MKTGRLKRVLRHITETVSLGIIYDPNCNSRVLNCYSDADFGGCGNTGRSTSGAVVIYAGGAVSWLSRKQVTVALSTTEAELTAATEATKEVLWLSRLYKEINNLKDIPLLEVDNFAAVRLAQDPTLHSRTKHIDRRLFFLLEKS
jgi:hypothetical protein